MAIIYNESFGPGESDALQTVIDLAWSMISDDGQIEPGNEDAVAAIKTVETFLTHNPTPVALF